MKKKYIISISGKQILNGEEGVSELTTFGTYLKKGDKRYISYDEYNEDVNQSVKTTLKVETDDKVTLMRNKSSSRLILEKGRRHQCFYDVSFGNTLMLGVFANSIENNLTDDGGRLHFKYTLDIDSSITSLNEVDITVKEAENSCQK